MAAATSKTAAARQETIRGDEGPVTVLAGPWEGFCVDPWGRFRRSKCAFRRASEPVLGSGSNVRSGSTTLRASANQVMSMRMQKPYKTGGPGRGWGALLAGLHHAQASGWNVVQNIP